MKAVPRGTAVTVPKKRPPKIAFEHFVWQFIVGKPQDSTTIIAKKLCLGSTRRFHIYIYIYIYIHPTHSAHFDAHPESDQAKLILMEMG